MEAVILNDKSIEPTNELIFSIIGDKKILWEQTLSYLYDNNTAISEKWKYYNDGKSWLFRTLKKNKTILNSESHEKFQKAFSCNRIYCRRNYI